MQIFLKFSKYSKVYLSDFFFIQKYFRHFVTIADFYRIYIKKEVYLTKFLDDAKDTFFYFPVDWRRLYADVAVVQYMQSAAND